MIVLSPYLYVKNELSVQLKKLQKNKIKETSRSRENKMAIADQQSCETTLKRLTK